MKKMNAADNGFLMVERPQTPMHVAGLTIMKFPQKTDPSKFVTELLQDFGIALAGIYPLNHKLKMPFLNIGLPSLIPDDSIDLEYHTRHYALPAPGTMQQLTELTSRFHSTLLDRNRPLWELYIIEGLENDRFAIYFKVHHSIMDGIGAMNLMKEFFTTSEDDQTLNSLRNWKKKVHSISKNDESLFDKWLSIASKVPIQLKNLRDLGGIFLSIGAQLTMHEPIAPPWYTAPNSPLNVKIDGQRLCAVTSFSVKDFKQIGKAHQATINDVILAVCAGGLRKFFQKYHSVPKKPMTVCVPVAISTNKNSNEEQGNAISSVICDLGVQIENPVKRLEHIHNSTTESKSQLTKMSKEAIDIYNMVMVAPFITAQLLNVANKIPIPFNILISNVPASDKKLYLAGAEMEALYGVNLIFEMQALNITVTSYLDSLDFSFIACRKTLPELSEIVTCLNDAYDELSKEEE